MPDRAAWIFCRNDGNQAPQFPEGVEGSWSSACELHRIKGADHTHALVGGYAIRSNDPAQTDGHTHYVAWFGNNYQQATVNGTHHTHDLTVVGEGDQQVLVPDYYLVFWSGDQASFDLIEADNQTTVAAEANTQDGVGDLDSTPWTTEEKEWWDNTISNQLSIDLPSQITAGDRLVAFFVGALVGRPQQKEQWLRPSFVDAPEQAATPYPPTIGGIDE